MSKIYSIICCKHNNVGVRNNVELTIGSLDVYTQKNVFINRTINSIGLSFFKSI